MPQENGPPPYSATYFPEHFYTLSDQNQSFAPQYFIGGPDQQGPASHVVVTQKPQPLVPGKTVKQPNNGDYYFTMSVVVTIICAMCVGLPSLLCMVPAIVLSISAKDDAADGNIELAKQKGYLALALNVVALVVGVVLIVVFTGAILASVFTSEGCYYYYFSYTCY